MLFFERRPRAHARAHAAAGDDDGVCTQKLVDAGLTLEQLRAMDDVTLRRAGVVVKSQRDKVLQALQAL